jgi:hypothetical protein
VAEAVARVSGSNSGTEAEAATEARRIWARSSEALERLAGQAGAAYVHIIQPNQYLPGSKPLSDDERRFAMDPPGKGYRDAIERHFGALGFDSVAVSRTVDLRLLFQGDSATRYRDRCCHLNASGMERVADAIIERQRAMFLAALAR